ncbi:Gfo/Idh/MocA family protein [Virgibacillus sp. W0181]|uniref:Gfo/Idh/MocA family protein n=1 Tax=Virgibacillus sp. W0181 TaxID=3391581 RepID=UPI003F45D8B5
MTEKRKIRFGIIGCGLMGREFASASARWCHLLDLDFQPEIVAVCDSNPAMLDWFVNEISSVEKKFTNHKELLKDPSVEAIYCAVPHHLHEQIYIDIIEAGKHLLGEKPFGIDFNANQNIIEALNKNPNVIVRCSSEFPFYPGAYQISEWVNQNRFGSIIEVETGFWHSSDLDPNKPINWKREIKTNGEYGCMGDLGMHVLHLPLRFGWKPQNIRGHLGNIIHDRPNTDGKLVPCETWDNAILTCDAVADADKFPLIMSMKRIAPGHANTWFIRIIGTEFSAEYNTKYPKQMATLSFRPGENQGWKYEDLPYKSAYPTITGSIFEFGFSDSILQMWAAFCDELVNGQEMSQSFYCATPQEAVSTHHIFTAALESQRTSKTVALNRSNRSDVNVGLEV